MGMYKEGHPCPKCGQTKCNKSVNPIYACSNLPDRTDDLSNEVATLHAKLQAAEAGSLHWCDMHTVAMKRAEAAEAESLGHAELIRGLEYAHDITKEAFEGAKKLWADAICRAAKAESTIAAMTETAKEASRVHIEMHNQITALQKELSDALWSNVSLRAALESTDCECSLEPTFDPPCVRCAALGVGK